MFFLRNPQSLEVRAWEHKQTKQRLQNNEIMRAIMRAIWVATFSNLYLEWLDIWLADVYSNNALMQYPFLTNLTQSNLYVDTKQLASEFLQDALSKKAT